MLLLNVNHHISLVTLLMSVYITSCGFDWLMYKRKAKQFYFVCTSEEELKHFTAFHKPIVFFITLLASLIGLHFQVLGVSPLEKHFTIILLFIMDIIVYTIAYMRINLQPHNKEYLPILRWICLISGIIACELLVAILTSLFWLFIINFCAILIVEILRLCHQNIYQLLSQIQDWFQQLFQSIRLKAFQAFSSNHGTTEWTISTNHGTMEAKDMDTQMTDAA